MEKTESQLLKNVNESISVIRKYTDMQPGTGIILGTGLGALAREIEQIASIPYHDIPHFPLSTVESHSGRLIFGKLSGKDIVAMQGRFHYYEGYTMAEITYPVRVMKMLGIANLIISNACGSMNPHIRKGAVMLIDDHINLLGGNPLIGLNDESFGPRFPDMSIPYSPELIKIAEEVAVENKIKISKGVYAAMSGPSFETRAEYRFMRTIGADVVGMSTIPETIVARQMGLQVLGISIVTDECYPDALKPATLDEIIAAACVAEPKLTLLVREILRHL